MFMVNSAKEGTSFWARYKPFLDGVIKAGVLVMGLKLTKYVLDKN